MVEVLKVRKVLRRGNKTIHKDLKTPGTLMMTQLSIQVLPKIQIIKRISSIISTIWTSNHKKSSSAAGSPKTLRLKRKCSSTPDKVTSKTTISSRKMLGMEALVLSIEPRIDLP